MNFLADRPALLVLFAEDFAFFEFHFAELLLTAEWIDPVIERPLFLVDFTHLGPGVIAVLGIVVFVFVFVIRPAIRSAARRISVIAPSVVIDLTGLMMRQQGQMALIIQRLGGAQYDVEASAIGSLQLFGIETGLSVLDAREGLPSC